MISVGVDIGLDGAFFIMDNGDYRWYVMPTKTEITGKKKVRKLDLPKLSSLFNMYIHSSTNEHRIMVIEEPHAIFGASKSSMFKMARELGNTEGMAIHDRTYPVHMTPPKEWQKHIWIEDDIVLVPSKSGKTMVKDTKATSLNAFIRLFPELAPPVYGMNEEEGRKRKVHDGIVDAALMAKYGEMIINKHRISK